MTRFSRTFVAVLLVGAAFAAMAVADTLISTTIPVNDNTAGVFDQPSVAMNGAVAHTAFIGDPAGTGAFQVYYAAVNGSVDFTNPLLTRSQALVTFPVPVIDNVGAPLGGATYADARHPRIALRTPTQVVIFFQAKPTSPADPAFLLYRALLTVENNAVQTVAVRLIEGAITAGDIEDVSFGLVTADNTARIAYANRPAAGIATPFQVYFARVGLDNALVVGTPIRLSSGDNDTVTGSDGFRPIPSMRVDGLNRSHVAWAATDDSASNAGKLHYALVRDAGSGVDNIAVGATQVLAPLKRWSHPNLLLLGTSTVTVLAAADETVPAVGTPGRIGISQFNPDALTLGTVTYSIKDQTLDSSLDVIRPEAFLDSQGGIHVTGYGVDNAIATYYVVTTSPTFPFALVSNPPHAVRTDERPGNIAGDYTKAAIGQMSGKALVFWSGRVAGSSPERRNLDVSATSSVVTAVSEESGCAMVGAPGIGETGRIPGAAILFLPAAVLAFRRAWRRRGRAIAR